jgi:hypothetical protein
MPYASEAQRNFFHSSTGMAKLGAKEVKKWDAESKGHASNKDLPKYAGKLKKRGVISPRVAEKRGM